jgi:hypothetical protein
MQAFGFLLAGYETTASSLAFTIYNLSCHPDKTAKLMQVGQECLPCPANKSNCPFTAQLSLLQKSHTQTKLLDTWEYRLADAWESAQEIDAFGRDKVPGNRDLEQLPYVQAVFKESLRLFPPGHISIREAVEDLNLNGCLIEKGTWLHVRLFLGSTIEHLLRFIFCCCCVAGDGFNDWGSHLVCDSLFLSQRLHSISMSGCSRAAFALWPCMCWAGVTVRHPPRPRRVGEP